MTARSERRSTSAGNRRGLAVRTVGSLLAVVGLVLGYAGVTADSVALTVGLALLGLTCFVVGLGLARAPWYLEEEVVALVRLFV